MVVSLIILMVMTMIGVSALSSTNLEERMSHNFQQTMQMFQATESAIEKIIIAGDAGGAGKYENPFYVSANDPLKTAINAGLDDVSTVYTTADIDGNTNAPINATATVSYKGTTVCPETSFDELVCYMFEITSSTAIVVTNSNDTHVQTVERPAPGIAGVT
jgi:hypothetical protein